ncbi:MAG: YdcF family protein [Vicinamibacterales bacterium]
MTAVRARVRLRRRLLVVAGAAVAVAGAVIAAAECAHVAAGLPRLARHPQPCAVLALGFPSHRDGSPSAVQRLRMAAALRGAAEHQCDLIVVSGGAAHRAIVEADVMAALADGSGIRVARERAARNTWENVGHSLPLLEGHRTIFVASEGLHARRAIRYVCEQRPARCGDTDVVPTDRPWSMLPYRTGSAFYELAAWVRDAFR